MTDEVKLLRQTLSSMCQLLVMQNSRLSDEEVLELERRIDDLESQRLILERQVNEQQEQLKYERQVVCQLVEQLKDAHKQLEAGPQESQLMKELQAQKELVEDLRKKLQAAAALTAEVDPRREP